MADLTRTADRIASELIAKLKSGEIPKIDISRIRGAILRDRECPHTPVGMRDLEALTTRRVVEKCA